MDEGVHVAQEPVDPGSCPLCDTPWSAVADQGGMVTCAGGHSAYVGYVREASYLAARLGWLRDRIGAGEPAPDAETARRYVVWAVPDGDGAAGAASLGTAQAPAVPAGGRGLQVLLLSVGAWLLIGAAAVFAAVVWDRLGAAGQIGVMLLTTVLFAGAAARLAGRLPNTAQALAVVAFGLAVVDIFAASALGLLPKSWLGSDYPHLYPVTAVLVLAAGAVLLGHRLRVRAWVWLGWAAGATVAYLVSVLLAKGVAGGAQPWAAASVSVVSLAGVGLLAGPYVSTRLRADRGPMTVAGVLALVLAFAGWADHGSRLDRGTLAGTTVTVLLTAAAAGAVYWRTRLRPAGYGAASLVGVSGGLALLLVQLNAQSLWLATAVATAGLALFAVLARANQVRAGLTASATLWATWALGAIAIGQPVNRGDQVTRQLCVLLALVAVIWFAVAGAAVRFREPGMAWPAAVAGEVALLVSPIHLSTLPEAWTLPFAALLLLAGGLWHRSRAAQSLVWLGPGVAMALLPSALACWAAPWVFQGTEQGSGEALVRTVLVLVAGVLAVAVGAHGRLAGLLVPGSIALTVAGGAQLWGGLASLPRWVALGLAGATLVTLGARIEWLRGRGRTLRAFAGALH